MKVRVRLFAAAKELAGRDTLEVELVAGARIGHLRAAIGEQFPGLATMIRHTYFAVDTEYVPDQSLLPVNCEVACIPPVSGG